jgi:energy-coupling factor transport system substrate-specific component
MLVAFLLFRAFVFPASPTPIARQVRFFVLVNLAGVVQVWLVANGLATLVHPALAHAVGIAVPTLTSWFGHRMLTFAR